MTAAALAPLAVGDPGRYAALAAVLALFVGTLCFLAGLVRLGFLADLLSRPVLVGYMAGVAIILIASQLGTLSGVAVKGDEFVDQIGSFMGGLHHVHWPMIMLSAVLLVALVLLTWRMPRAPGSLIVMLAATATVSVFSLDHSGIRAVGQVPGGLPVPGVTGIPLTDAVALLVPAGGIAIVAFSDNVLTARTFAARKGEYIDANAELRALGVCNLGAAVVQGFPVSCSGSRTAVGDAVGSRTQLYSLVALVFLVIVMLTSRGLLAMFPTAALGALVVYAAARLIDVRSSDG